MNYYKVNAGIEKMTQKKALIVIPVIYIAILFSLAVFIRGILERLGQPYSGNLFVFCLYAFVVVLLVTGVLAIIEHFGKSLGGKVEKRFVDVGFVKEVDEAPILITKNKSKNGLIFEFFSPRVPYSKYEERKSEVETALNVNIIEIVQGKDKRHVVIKAVDANRKKEGIFKWNDDYMSDKDFELVLGESVFGKESIDIASTPHVLIGGASGSGKSKLLKLLLMESIKKGAVIYLADFKGGVDYPEVWHKTCTIITDTNELNKKLDRILMVMEERRKTLLETGKTDIAKLKKENGMAISRIIVACDEIAEVLDKTGLDKEQKAIVSQIESKLSTIARMGRAFGEHLILSTQRPDADILKGQIKTNIGYRICGRADKILSQIILDNSKAAEMIKPSDQGIFLTNTGVQFKAYYVEDDCLKGVDFNGETKDQGQTDTYD